MSLCSGTKIFIARILMLGSDVPCQPQHLTSIFRTSGSTHRDSRTLTRTTLPSRVTYQGSMTWHLPSLVDAFSASILFLPVSEYSDWSLAIGAHFNFSHRSQEGCPSWSSLLSLQVVLELVPNSCTVHMANEALRYW